MKNEIGGAIVSVIVVKVNDEENYVRGMVPAIVDGQKGVIDTVYLQNADEYRILGWHRATEDGIGERTKTIPDGAELQFIYFENQNDEMTISICLSTRIKQ